MPCTSSRQGVLRSTSWRPAGGISKDNFLKHFPGVFADEVGQLDGEYHIKVDATVEPVQHPPRRLPVALRDLLKAELDRMVSQDVSTPVATSTPGVSSLVVVPKKDGGSHAPARGKGVVEAICSKRLLARENG